MARQQDIHGQKRYRLGVLATLCLCAFLFSGCGEQTPPAKATGRLRIGLMITPNGLNDKGFNDQAYAGLIAAGKKYGIETVVIEPATMKDPEASLRFFAGQTFDAIIAVGLAFYDAIKIVSKDHPNLMFFVIDSAIEEPNIRGVAFREDEGSFLCGFLAGKITKTGKVGFVGGMKNEVIGRFLEGFRGGVQMASSGILVHDRFIAENYSGFNQPQRAKTLTTELYNNGCDLVYHAAGASGLGVISAAVDAKKYVIGVDMNQDALAPGLVLTSMLKRVDLVVEDVVKTLAEGKGIDKVKRTYGLNDGAIGLTEFQFSQQVVGSDLIKQIAELRKKLIEGGIKTGVASLSR